MQNPLCVYITHDDCLSFKVNDRMVSLELERWLGKRYGGFVGLSIEQMRSLVLTIRDYIYNTYSPLPFDGLIHSCGLRGSSVQVQKVKKVVGMIQFHFAIPQDRIYFLSHYLAHNAGSFYTSSFQRALCFAYDGGGYYTKYKVGFSSCYLMDRNAPPQDITGCFRGNFGGTLLTLLERFPFLKGEPLGLAGKFMGLAGCGKIIPQLVSPFKKSLGFEIWGKAPYKELTPACPALFNKEIILSFDEWANVAASLQQAFEESVIEKMDPIINQYPDLPICLSGGCALNVKLNSTIKNKYNRPVHISCNPNDSGIAVGILLNHLNPSTPQNITYNNFPIPDLNLLSTYTKKTYNFTNLVSLLKKDKVLAVMRGDSECGPRALGNRSIIARVTDRALFNKVNREIKFREDFRPLAPVCRLQDVSKYFEFEGESPFMSFAPLVRLEYRSQLPVITHVDGTSRVQTITRQQHSFLYDLLTEMENQGEIPIVLNTSFNSKGKPIVRTVKEALEIYQSTKLDALIIEDYLFEK